MKVQHLKRAICWFLVLLLNGCTMSKQSGEPTPPPQSVSTAQPSTQQHPPTPPITQSPPVQPNLSPTEPRVDHVPAPLKPSLIRSASLESKSTSAWNNAGVEVALPETDFTLPRTLWLNDSALAITQRTETTVVNMLTQQVVSISDAQFPGHPYLRSRSVSPDGRRMAFIRNHQLVVLEQGGEEVIWDLAETITEQDVFFVNMFSWSPDSRYLLGSFDHTAIGKVKPSKLWLVDAEERVLTSLVEKSVRGRAYARVTWSPKSDQAVIWDSPTWDKTGSYSPDVQWLHLDCATGALKVIVPQNRQPLTYGFSWDATGHLHVTPELLGPDKTYAVITDPDTTDPWRATQLQYLSQDGSVMHTVDLWPSIGEAGVPPETAFCYLNGVWSPDGRYLLVEGSAYTGYETYSSDYMLLGSIDAKTGEIGFLATRPRKRLTNPLVMSDHRWLGTRVLVNLGNRQDGLGIFNVVDRSLVPLMVGEQVIAASVVGNNIIVVTASNAVQFTLNGDKSILASAPKGAEFADTSCFSLTGRYLALVIDTSVKIVDLGDPGAAVATP